MRQWFIGMIAWLFAFNVHAQQAQTYVTLSVAQGVLQALYRLPAPVTRFVFADHDSPQRQAGWVPRNEDWNFDGTVVSRTDGEEFSAFALELYPDRRFFDRHYVAVERVGSDGAYGFFHNADHLQLDTGQRCGTSLANDPAIASVDGINLFANPVEAHAVMRAACAEGKALVFGTLERKALTPMPCKAAIEELPQVIELGELPVLPK